MSARQDTSRIAWLTAKLGAQRGRIMKLLQRMGDLGSVQGMKPKIFSKFLNLMEQIADEHDEETKLLSEIEAIEKKHRYQRKSGRLKRAEPKSRDFDVDARLEERPRNAWLWIFVLWYMATRPRPGINKS